MGSSLRLIVVTRQELLATLYADNLEDHWGKLAHHYARSDNDPNAVIYLHLAGGQAARRTAYRQAAALLLVDGCGGSHACAGQAQAEEHRIRLIPARYVEPCRRRGKSNSIDTKGQEQTFAPPTT